MNSVVRTRGFEVYRILQSTSLAMLVCSSHYSKVKCQGQSIININFCMHLLARISLVNCFTNQITQESNRFGTTEEYSLYQVLYKKYMCYPVTNKVTFLSIILKNLIILASFDDKSKSLHSFNAS